MTIPGLSPYPKKAVPLAQRSAAAAAITSSYTLVGTLFSAPVVYLLVTSTLDQAVQLSFDGVTDHMAIGAGNTTPQVLPFDFKENGIVLPGNFGIYVKEIGNPSSGNLYVAAFSL